MGHDLLKNGDSSPIYPIFKKHLNLSSELSLLILLILLSCGEKFIDKPEQINERTSRKENLEDYKKRSGVRNKK